MSPALRHLPDTRQPHLLLYEISLPLGASSPAGHSIPPEQVQTVPTEVRSIQAQLLLARLGYAVFPNSQWGRQTPKRRYFFAGSEEELPPLPWTDIQFLTCQHLIHRTYPQCYPHWYPQTYAQDSL